MVVKIKAEPVQGDLRQHTNSFPLNSWELLVCTIATVCYDGLVPPPDGLDELSDLSSDALNSSYSFFFWQHKLQFGLLGSVSRQANHLVNVAHLDLELAFQPGIPEQKLSM